MRQGKARLRRALGDTWLRLSHQSPVGGRLIVFMYHAITDRPENDPEQLTVPTRLFADQLRWLKELGYPVLPLTAAVARLRQGTLDRPVVSLTFDDGYRSTYIHALPALLAHGYPATVFLVPGVLDGIGRPDFVSPHGGPLLSWTEAREMLRHGISFGAHGMTHRKLSHLPPDEVTREIGSSKRAIEDALSTAVTEFSYPFGSFDAFTPMTEAIVTRFGFEAVCSTIAGHNRRPADTARLRRLRISWMDDSRREIWKQCRGAYNWYALYQWCRDGLPSRTRPTAVAS